MSILRLVVATSLVALTIANPFAVPAAFAQEGPPPDADVVTEVTTATVIGPEVISAPGERPGVSALQTNANAYHGTQGANLAAGVAYWGAFFPPYRTYGFATITVTGGPTAKAWDTLSVGGTQVGTTSSSPCWTTSTCTSTVSRANGFDAFAGQHVLSFAEATVFWSDSTNLTFNATQDTTLP